MDGEVAEHLHRAVFDVEHALVSLAEICMALAAEQVPAARAEAAAQMTALAAGRSGEGAPLRLTAQALRQSAGASDERACELLDRAAEDLSAYQRSIRTVAGEVALASEEHLTFRGVITLEGTQPLGGRPLTGRAATAAARIWWWRVPRPALVIATAIQAAIATAIAIPIGDAFDPSRYYWAVIGVLAIIGTVTTPHDRGRKVVRRILGTVFGAVLGIAIHQLTGQTHPWWTLTIILLALTIGAYAISVSYPVFVTGLVIALVQLYALAGGNLNILLVHRLAENALGAVIAMIVTLVVLPISTRAVIRVGLHGYLQAMKAFVADFGRYLNGPDTGIRLRFGSRALDHALFQSRQVASHLI